MLTRKQLLTQKLEIINELLGVQDDPVLLPEITKSTSQVKTKTKTKKPVKRRSGKGFKPPNSDEKVVASMVKAVDNGMTWFQFGISYGAKCTLLDWRYTYHNIKFRKGYFKNWKGVDNEK